jgi:hypothetical protein
MSASGRFPTHHIPDDGTRYATGETVRVDLSSGRVEIVKDPAGDYEVVRGHGVLARPLRPPTLAAARAAGARPRVAFDRLRRPAGRYP